MVSFHESPEIYQNNWNFLLKIPESSIQWEVDLFPRGVRYNKAQLINVYMFTQGNNNSSAEIPETVLKVMRLRATCKANLKEEEKKFKVRKIFELLLILS